MSSIAKEGKTKQAKPDSVKKALEYCSGCVSADTLKEAKNRYQQLSAILKDLDKHTLDKITSDTKNVRFCDITEEDKDLGGPLFKTLFKAKGQINLSDVWPKYVLLIKAYRKQEGHTVIKKSRGKDTMEPSGAQDTISTILGKSQNLKKCDRNTVKKAYEQYHSLKHVETKDKNIFAVECHRLTVKYKKVIIEPNHVSTAQRHRVPELYTVVTEAWGSGMEDSEAAIKDLFVLLEANEAIMLHSEYDVRMSFNARSSSAAKKTSKSPKTIEYVLNLCKKKYKPEVIEKANHEYKHLEKLDEEIKRHRELEVRKDKWHEIGASGPQEILDSIVEVQRPLHKVLSWAKEDGIQDSALALLEYGSLLHSESLLSSKDDLVTVRQTEEDTKGTKQSESKSGDGIENVLINSKHLVNHGVYGQAYEEYEKLETYSNFVAKDDVLRERKHRWTMSVPNGPLTFLKKFESPTRPLHVVLNLAKTKNIPGSDMALREYGSLLHTEVLYESKDSVTQFCGGLPTLPVDNHDEHSKASNRDSERSDDGGRHRSTAISTEIPILISSGDDLKRKTSLDLGNSKNKDVKHEKPYQEMRHDPVHNPQYRDDRKLLELQQMCEILEEKLSMKNAEIEDLTSRLSQAASKSLMTNNPSIADLSDKNRPTKLGERFGQLYDNEWSDAHEKLQHVKKSEHEILFVLSEIVKDCFSFCERAFEQQVKRIQRDLETSVLGPTFYLSSRKEEFIKGYGKKDKMLDFMCQQNATEFQKSVAIHSVLGLTQIYKELSKKKKQIPDFEKLLRYIDPYVDASVELCWLMCVQTPPMKLVFANKNDRVDKSHFRLFGTTGEKVDICVWPALLLHDGGPVVMKGQVLPK